MHFAVDGAAGLMNGANICRTCGAARNFVETHWLVLAAFAEHGALRAEPPLPQRRRRRAGCGVCRAKLYPATAACDRAVRANLVIVLLAEPVMPCAINPLTHSASRRMNVAEKMGFDRAWLSSVGAATGLSACRADIRATFAARVPVPADIDTSWLRAA